MIFEIVKVIVDRRWVILKHVLSKDSFEGLHYDLLLEDVNDCRSWRLSSIPLLNGPLVEAIATTPHKFYWLERDESLVSGGRGWAKQIYRGTFSGSLPVSKSEMISIEIISTSLKGRLQIVDGICRITSSPKFDFI